MVLHQIRVSANRHMKPPFLDGTVIGAGRGSVLRAKRHMQASEVCLGDSNVALVHFESLVKG